MGEHFFFLNHTFNMGDITSKKSKMDFTTYLPKEILLSQFDSQNNPVRWSLALTDFLITSSNEEYVYSENDHCADEDEHNNNKVATRSDLKNRPYIVLTDLVSESYLKGRFLPILRIFYPEVHEATPLIVPYYFPVNTNSFNSVRIYFFNEEDLSPLYTYRELKLSCTLHLLGNRV